VVARHGSFHMVAFSVQNASWFGFSLTSQQSENITELNRIYPHTLWMLLPLFNLIILFICWKYWVMSHTIVLKHFIFQEK
jgi:TRAP-type C4-dicarboxylate transport system permease large subunit